MRARTVSVQDGLALGELGPLCVALWRSEVTRERFDRQAAALADVVMMHPGRAVFICIVEPDAKPPNEELRVASAKMVSQHGELLARVAAVIEGTGFQAAVTRSVLTAIELFIPKRKTKVGYFSDVASAARWARTNHGTHGAHGVHGLDSDLPPVSAIVAHVAQLRARL